jgi:hypothetical protein
MDKYEAFLEELTALSKKHGLIISGCGCCGSPRVTEIDEDSGPGPYIFDEEDEGKLHWPDKRWLETRDDPMA